MDCPARKYDDEAYLPCPNCQGTKTVPMEPRDYEIEKMQELIKQLRHAANEIEKHIRNLI